MKRPRLFCYSGNKSRYIDYYRSPPHNTARIVEPYLGAGAYTLAYNFPGSGLDINENIITLWKYLKSSDEKQLRKLEKIFVKQPDKTDIRSIPNLSPGELLYLKINVCSVVVGQLTSWLLYKKHSLPIEQTISLLPKLQNIEVCCASAETYQAKAGDLIFLDPPYSGTFGGYKTNKNIDLTKNYNPNHTIELIKRITNPIILTYGNGAPQVFPDYKWELVAERKVPNMRKKGFSSLRQEYVSYINW